MEKIDGRRLKQEVQQALRDQVVRLRKQGKMNKDVAEFLGISPQHASTIWQKYVRGGKKEVLLGTRGIAMARREPLLTSRNGKCRNSLPTRPLTS